MAAPHTFPPNCMSLRGHGRGGVLDIGASLSCGRRIVITNAADICCTGFDRRGAALGDQG